LHLGVEFGIAMKRFVRVRSCLLPLSPGSRVNSAAQNNHRWLSYYTRHSHRLAQWLHLYRHPLSAPMGSWVWGHHGCGVTWVWGHMGVGSHGCGVRSCLLPLSPGSRVNNAAQNNHQWLSYYTRHSHRLAQSHPWGQVLPFAFITRLTRE